MSEKNQLLEGDLAQIIASYMRRIDAGEPVDQQRILMDHPHLRAELESYFSDVAMSVATLRLGLQPGQLLAAAGLAETGAALVADDAAGKADQDRDTGKICAVPL